jgi:hypothetical protein
MSWLTLHFCYVIPVELLEGYIFTLYNTLKLHDEKVDPIPPEFLFGAWHSIAASWGSLCCTGPAEHWSR